MNDTPATATELIATSGSLSGTLAGAAMDTIVLPASWEAYSVYYYWQDLPAGLLTVTFDAIPPFEYIEYWCALKVPTDLTRPDYFPVGATGSGWSGGWQYDGEPAIRLEVPTDGPLSLVVTVFDPDPLCAFSINWALGSARSTPTNDTAATAELLPIGSYWGVASGSTIAATTSPMFDEGHDVWFRWSYLPPGDVYVFIKPRSANANNFYIEGLLYSKAPTEVTADDDYGWGANSDYEWDRGMFQVAHPGGPLTLVVVTYENEMYDFDLGWGHEFDTTPDHWDTTLYAPAWETKAVGVDDGGLTAGLISECYFYRDGDVQTPPANQALVQNAYENAKRGVSYDGYGPVNLPPGPGRDHNEEIIGFDYGASSHEVGYPQLFDRKDGYRIFERMLFIYVGLPGSGFHGKIPEGRSPDEWDGLIDPDIPGNEDSENFNWGWHYASKEWVTGDLQFTMFPHGAGTHPTILLKWVPEENFVDPNKPAISFVQPNQVRVSNYGSGNQYSRDWSWHTIDDLPAETLVELPPPQNGRVIVTLPDWGRLPQAGGELQANIAILLVSKEVVEGFVPPAFHLPTPIPFSGFGQTSDYYASYADDVRQSGEAAASHTAQYKLPDWRVYRGFPLVPPAPSTVGWHIGRLGAGAW